MSGGLAESAVELIRELESYNGKLPPFQVRLKSEVLGFVWLRKNLFSERFRRKIDYEVPCRR